MSNAFPLTPGFSPVAAEKECQNRFNGFALAGKPLKRLVRSIAPNTRLKPLVSTQLPSRLARPVEWQPQPPEFPKRLFHGARNEWGESRREGKLNKTAASPRP